MMGYVGDAEKDLCIQRAFCIMRNRKYPAKYKVLVERIQNECMNIYCYLMDANRLQLDNAKSERLELQTKAIGSCDKLSCYAELSMNLNLISSNIVEQWQKKISEIKYMTIGWRKKDRLR